MSHPIPSGTRDVLPDENRELRAVADALRGAFEARGYGEVATPALEYDEVLQRGGLGAAAPAYRLFDEHGNVLVLRSDMTVPIARVAATRYANAEPPLRFQYNATSYRAVRPQRGHSREVLQAGIELIGAPAPDGTAEAVAVLCEGLDAVGLRNYRLGLGDASLYPSLLAAAGVPEDARGPLVKELATRDFVGLEREVRALGLDAAEAALLVEAPQRRGGAETLEASHPALAPAVEGLRRVLELLPAAARGRVILDLGLVRDLDYYTGAVFEVYDPALGAPLGGGGRYDDLLGRFGRPLPAVGFALDVEALHLALAAEERR